MFRLGGSTNLFTTIAAGLDRRRLVHQLNSHLIGHGSLQLRLHIIWTSRRRGGIRAFAGRIWHNHIIASPTPTASRWRQTRIIDLPRRGLNRCVVGAVGWGLTQHLRSGRTGKPCGSRIVPLIELVGILRNAVLRAEPVVRARAAARSLQHAPVDRLLDQLLELVVGQVEDFLVAQATQGAEDFGEAHRIHKLRHRSPEDLPFTLGKGWPRLLVWRRLRRLGDRGVAGSSHRGSLDGFRLPHFLGQARQRRLLHRIHQILVGRRCNLRRLGWGCLQRFLLGKLTFQLALHLLRCQILGKLAYAERIFARQENFRNRAIGKDLHLALTFSLLDEVLELGEGPSAAVLGLGLMKAAVELAHQHLERAQVADKAPLPRQIDGIDQGIKKSTLRRWYRRGFDGFGGGRRSWPFGSLPLALAVGLAVAFGPRGAFDASIAIAALTLPTLRAFPTLRPRAFLTLFLALLLRRLQIRDLFIKQKFIAALGQVRAGRPTNADDDHIFAVLPDRVNQRDKVTVAGHQHKLIDVGLGVQRAHRVDAEMNIDAVFDRTPGAANFAVIMVGGNVHRLNAVGEQRGGHPGIAIPVGIRAGDYDPAVVFAAVHDQLKVRLSVELFAHRHIHVFEINKNRYIGAGFCSLHNLYVSPSSCTIQDSEEAACVQTGRKAKVLETHVADTD